MCEEAIQRERELNCEGEVEVNVREMVCEVVGEMPERAMRSKVEIMCEEVIGELNWTFIQVTYDCPGLNNNNIVPILDHNVRMEW